MWNIMIFLFSLNASSFVAYLLIYLTFGGFCLFVYLDFVARLFLIWAKVIWKLLTYFHIQTQLLIQFEAIEYIQLVYTTFFLVIFNFGHQESRILFFSIEFNAILHSFNNFHSRNKWFYWHFIHFTHFFKFCIWKLNIFTVKNRFHL